VAVGRRAADLRALGVEEAGGKLSDRGVAEPDEQLRIGEAVFVAGDSAGGLQFTHVADHEGRLAARAAMGNKVRLDLSAVPRCTYTDPEAGAVGRTLEEAQADAVDAFEVTQDFSTTARGYSLEPVRPSDEAILEGAPGHVTIVVDRERRVLVGGFAACPGASDLIHEAVLAIKHRVPVEVLADTIHAFPAGARVLGNLFIEAEKQL